MGHPVKRAVRCAVPVLLASFALLFPQIVCGQSTLQNTISTVAGGPPPNNVAPTAAAATLEGPQSVVRDPSGNFFVVTDTGVIYKITPSPGTMTVYAGNNTAGFTPNGPAASTLTNEPFGSAVDASGNLYYSDSNNCVVRKIVSGVTPTVQTVAGNGACGYSGDNGPATSAMLSAPLGIAIDTSGNLFIADYGNSIIRKVTDGSITTYAGIPDQTGYSGDNVAATSALLNFPEAVAVDTAGNLYIADTNNNRIRRVDTTATHVITTVAGNGTEGYSGDGGLATAATLGVPDGVAVDNAGNIYIADTVNAVIREVFSPNETMPNIIETIVGNNTFGFGGDGGPALQAELTNPAGLFVDPASGDLWIADYWNNRIRLYTPTGNPATSTISTVIGSGLVGDNGPATSASFYFPRTPALDSQGNLYITDAENNRIREVANSDQQTVTTVVGNGIPCARPTLPCGDGGLATDASIYMPRTITIEANGNWLVADDGDLKIREVNSSGIINTIVGSGVQCTTATLPCGDGGPATSASVNDARGAVRDAIGNLYFVDAQDNRVREVNTTGTITTIAGGGPSGNAPTGCANGSYAGDGGPAVDSTLDCPLGLDIDSLGNLYVADTYNNVIRKIDTGSPRIITRIAGNGTKGHTGNGGPATSATLNMPDRVSVNGAGNFFISDSGNDVIRRVDGTSKIITAFAGNGTFGFFGDGGPALFAELATPVGVVVDAQGNMYVGDLYNNRVRNVLLNPNVNLSSTTVAFGNRPINATATLPLTVTNSGDAPLTISNISLNAEGGFSISANPCPVAPATLAVGAQCVLEIAFSPTQFVSYTATITISDNGPTSGSVQTIDLSGTGGASVTVTVTGPGRVTSSPGGISCPETCSATFAGDTQVTLTATPNAGSIFTGWGGDICEGTGACTFTITANDSVSANFASGGVSLTVTEAGTGTGTVKSVPSGINCPSACSANFASGAQVTLTASAAQGSTFGGWSGAGCSGTATCAVTLSAAASVTATFNSNSPVVISIGQGSSSTANTTPGGNATFGLLLTGAPGFTGTVQLTCASSSPNITCNIVPSAVTMTGKTTEVAIVVQTYCKGFVPNSAPMPGGFGTGLGLMLTMLSLCGAAGTFKKQPRWAVSFAAVIFLAVGMSACGSLPKSPSGAATPAGSYPLTVTATTPSGAISSMHLTLKVQ
ncbi:MAG: choice-of-anchor D domain-containing protein [Candidatus Acidiferrales bacterium]